MIFNTNRTTSLVEESVEVNESYFGAGSLLFMQECAEDELAIFSEAVKTDITEIGIVKESGDITALNEGFVETATKRIKDLMDKFIQWLNSITASVLNKLMQYLVRDNDKFVKNANKYIGNLKDDFKYNGKALKSTTFEGADDTKKVLDVLRSQWKEVESQESFPDAGKVKEKAKEAIKKAKEDNSAKNVAKAAVETIENGSVKVVKDHLEFLEKVSKDEVKAIMKVCAEYKKEAAAIAKAAKAASKKYKGDDENEKNKLAVLAIIANEFKQTGQTIIQAEVRTLRKKIAISRAVVTKALGSAVKTEGAEYTEELMFAMTESDNYEFDEIFEEMSACAETSDKEDDIEDEE